MVSALGQASNRLLVRHVKNDMTKLLLDQSLSSPKYALIYFSRDYDWLSAKKK